MKYLLLIPILFLPALSGCSSLPEEPKTIAAGAAGQVDYCVTVVGANLFCVNAKRTLDSE